MRIELNAIHLRQLIHLLRGVQPDRQDHHIEFFFLYAFLGRGVADCDILAFRDFLADGYIGSDELHTVEVFRPVIEALEVFAIGTNIVVEDGAFGLGIMIFGQNDLLLGIRTTDS